MKQLNVKLSGSQKLYVFPISDLHVGSTYCNYDYIDYLIDKINELKSQVVIYLLGDLIECGSLKVGNSAFCSDSTVDEQLDFVINTFKPLKRYVRFSCIGNHEARLYKDYHFDVNKIISKKLRCGCGSQFIDSIKINGKDFKFYGRHGSGSSKYLHTAFGKIIRDTQHIDADVFMEGHNHYCGHISVPIMSSEGYKRKDYVYSGHFLKYGNSYADYMTLPASPESFIRLDVNKDLVVNSKTFHIDKECPYLVEIGV